MSVNEIRDFNLENYYKQIVFTKENTKSVKQSRIITQQPETSKNPNNVDMKLVITEHQKTSHKLSKAIKQTEKVASNSSLYSDTKKWFFFKREKI